MTLLEKIKWYLENLGAIALLKRCFGIRPSNISAVMKAGYLPMVNEPTLEPPVKSNTLSASAFLESRYPAIQPLSIYSAPGPNARLNLVIDRLNTGSLFGGVGTAILISALLAKKRGAKLRVVTRTEAANETGFAQVLECNGIEFDDNIEFSHIDIHDSNAHLDVCDGDRFLTTSWWTTASILGSIRADRVDYLLQEDERMSYPYGDDWVRCNELFSRKDIRYLINTELLFKHLIDSGLTHLLECARWFEPAFSLPMYHRNDERVFSHKRQLFFYTHPNNTHNLFYRGIEVLDRAVSEGIIDSNQWDVIFVGKGAPKIRLAGLLEIRVINITSCSEYGKFIRNTDLGVCLMPTPHLSQMSLNLAASGAVVLTNAFGLKRNLKNYSENIICSDWTTNGLLAGLKQAIKLTQNNDARLQGYKASQFSRSWERSMNSSIDFLE